MWKRILVLLLAINLAAAPTVNSAVAADNAADLIGTWNVYNEANTLIDSITIDFAVTAGGKTRFNYSQASIGDGSVNALDGYMVNQDQIIFSLINMAESNIYIATVDFDNAGGPGVRLKTVLADCEVVGVDASLVKKQNQSRLASSSALCDASDFHDTELSNIKLVKSGTDPSAIASTAVIDSTITAALANKTDKIEGAWDVASGKKSSIRILTKDVAAHHLGYQFTYKTINKKKLQNVTNEDFTSGAQIGFLLDKFYLINSTVFNGKDSYGVFKLGASSGSGKLFQTPNADCFNLKNPDENKRICTPNDDTSLSDTDTQVINKAKVKKNASKVSISF